jgi:hypothetical protein
MSLQDLNDSVNSVVGLADKLGIIARVRSSLFSDPDIAMSKLADVIDIIIKDCDTLYDALEKLSSLEFDDEKNLSSSKKILYYVKTKQLYRDLNKSRDHCARIALIYKDHLNGWFSRVFKNDSNYSELNSLFKFELPDTDNYVLKAIKKLNDFAENYANEILNYIEGPQPDLNTAKEKVKIFNRDTSDLRTKINKKVIELTDLKDEFIRKSGEI